MFQVPINATINAAHSGDIHKCYLNNLSPNTTQIIFCSDCICSKCIFHVYVCVGDYILPLDHSVLVRSDICHLGYHGDTWDYVWRT